MKRKALIIAVFLVTGLVFSNFLAISSLSLTKQIKSTFSEEKNLGQEIGRPTGQEGRTLSFERGNFKWRTSMFGMFEGEFFSNTIPGNSLKVAAKYSSFLILLLIIIFVIRKHYKNKKMNNRIHKIEEVQKQPAVLENKDIIDTVSSAEEKKIATVQIHETRRLLKEWEARLESNRMKRDAETINEWFERINGPKEVIPIYERVRYGEKSCTEGEIRFMKNTFKL